MALAASSLSRACRSVADFLAAGLGASDNAIDVTVGTPHDAANLANGGHRLNLFVYRIEPDAFSTASVQPDEPWRLRLHCLITAFAVEEDNVSAGEADLRLLGEVIRLFHEQPLLDPFAIDDDEVQLHAVFETLTLDALNCLWSTQGETSLRPSVGYELALSPIYPLRGPPPAPLTGALTLVTGPELAPAAPESQTAAPDVAPVAIDASRADWTPQLAWVKAGALAYTMSLTPAEAAAFTPHVAVAGDPAGMVRLGWRTWTRAAGWADGPATEVAPTTTALDPDHVDPAAGRAVPAPALSGPGQLTLQATRTWTRLGGGPVTLTSNLLLVTVAEAHP